MRREGGWTTHRLSSGRPAAKPATCQACLLAVPRPFRPRGVEWIRPSEWPTRRLHDGLLSEIRFDVERKWFVSHTRYRCGFLITRVKTARPVGRAAFKQITENFFGQDFAQAIIEDRSSSRRGRHCGTFVTHLCGNQADRCGYPAAVAIRLFGGATARWAHAGAVQPQSRLLPGPG